MGERRRPPWRRPTVWLFAAVVVLEAANLARSFLSSRSPLADALGTAGLIVAGIAVVLAASLIVNRVARRRTMRDLDELYPGMFRFDALIGDGHRAARRARAERLGESDELPQDTNLAEVLVDEVGVRIVGNGWSSTLMLPADEVVGIAQGVETSGIRQLDALVLRLDVLGRLIDLPLAPMRDGGLAVMSRDEIVALGARIAGLLRAGAREGDNQS